MTFDQIESTLKITRLVALSSRLYIPIVVTVIWEFRKEGTY